MIGDIFKGIGFILKIFGKLLGYLFKGFAWYISHLSAAMKDGRAKKEKKVKFGGEIL